MKDEATRAFDACDAVAEALSERGIEASQDDVAAVTEAALRAYKGQEVIPVAARKHHGQEPSDV